MFDAGSDRADNAAFAERCQDDRHHLALSLLTWPGSAVVHDIKGENWRITAGFRARHGRVPLFDPTNPRSAAYNPLLEVRRGAGEVRDVQNVADLLVDPEGSLDKRNHWEKTSHSLLVGAILHVLYAEADKTLAGVAAFLSDPKRPIEKTLRAMMTTRHLGEAGPPPVVASTARELLNKSDNERSGVLSTAMSLLGLYRDPVVADVTRRCDWRIADLVADRDPATLYLVAPPSDISRAKPLIRMALCPSSTSWIISFTPFRLRPLSFFRKSIQNTSASEGPMRNASIPNLMVATRSKAGQRGRFRVTPPSPIPAIGAWTASEHSTPHAARLRACGRAAGGVSDRKRRCARAKPGGCRRSAGCPAPS
jgi:hypothetical protein